jgi:hypothetical protein
MTKAPKSPANALIEKLRLDVAELASNARSASLSPKGLKKLNTEIERAALDLTDLLAELDPIKRPQELFDPGNPRTIGFFIALAMTAQPRQPLATMQPLYGSGVYAIYYNGPFKQYAPLRKSETPIYVGQAAPGNENARTPVEQGIRLAARLNEHRKTIERGAAGSLNIKDFECRALVVQTGWETAAEDYLIRLFRPIWNKETKIIQGFGKHGDDPTKRSNKVSSWDVLHQGRAAAGHGINPQQKTEAELTKQLAEHFAKHRAYKTLNEVLDGFITALRQT